MGSDDGVVAYNLVCWVFGTCLSSDVIKHITFRELELLSSSGVVNRATIL